MGVVVRRYIDILTIIINFPYSTCIRSLLLCSFLKCFFVLVYVIFVQYIANVTQRTINIRDRSDNFGEWVESMGVASGRG